MTQRLHRMSKERLILATINKTNNTKINRIKITRKQKGKKNKYTDISKDQKSEISRKMS